MLAKYAASPTPEIPVSQFSVRGGLTFAGVGGQPRGVYERHTNNIMPRVGFAYSPDQKTVIRGGFGMYFGSLGTRLKDAIQTGFTRCHGGGPFQRRRRHLRRPLSPTRFPTGFCNRRAPPWGR